MNQLNHISEIRTGYNFRSIANTERQTVYLVSAKDLDTNFSDIAEIDIPATYNNYLQNGDILVKSHGTTYAAKVFKTIKQDHPCIAANTLLIVRITSKDYKPSYLAQIINSNGVQKYLKLLSSGQTVPFLSPSSLGSINCPKAPLERQGEIEIITEVIDDYQATLAKYIEAGENLTKALNAKLMEGVE